MLSRVVVYKHGDRMTGPGFFEFAHALGYPFRDETAFGLRNYEESIECGRVAIDSVVGAAHQL